MATELAALLGPLSAWFISVNQTVPEPYLDEIFHIPQAQHYCAGEFHIWDPKITTPPGLYLLSYISKPLLGCSVTSLRLISAICLVALLFLIKASYNTRRATAGENGIMSGILAAHSSLNIVLFPPLFFFSALYYTDVASTLSVMLFFWFFLRQLPTTHMTFSAGLTLVVLGVTSLFFRQTNIFWVAVAPAALTLVGELDRGHRVVKESMYKRAAGFGDSTFSVARTSWKMNVVFDPPVRDAYLEDYFRSILSIAICAVKVATQPKRIASLVAALLPYLTLIGLFVGFIQWNGSIVLGDKSNHIATINLPQMLYLWPFIAFFSLPLVLPHLLLVPLMGMSRMSSLAGLETLIIFRRRYFLPRWWLLALCTLGALVVVHFNTVVHPFMLADNRHYVFYVFKLLLRPWWVRYAVTPIYVLTAWACVEARGAQPNPTAASPQQGEVIRKQTAAEQGADASHADESFDEPKRALRLPDGTSTCSVSFIIISVATTALSLCFAPLVDPRYCIIPWMIWRMHLPLVTHDTAAVKKTRSLAAILEAYDYRLIAETLWFLLINAVTGYIFLKRTFEWPQNPGEVQRFMW